MIQSVVTAQRRYSKNMSHSSLEIPCKLTFNGPFKHVKKVEKLVKFTSSMIRVKLPVILLKKVLAQLKVPMTLGM